MKIPAYKITYKFPSSDNEYYMYIDTSEVEEYRNLSPVLEVLKVERLSIDDITKLAWSKNNKEIEDKISRRLRYNTLYNY